MTLGPFKIPRFLAAKNRECRELREHASAYLESDLPEDEKERIRVHLEMCADCRTFTDTLRETISMLGSLPTRTAPSELKDRLRRIARPEKNEQT